MISYLMASFAPLFASSPIWVCEPAHVSLGSWLCENSSARRARRNISNSKWFELLKEIAPRVNRVAVLREATVAGIGQFAAVQALAPIGVELSVIDIDDIGEIERDIAALADGPNGGLIVTPNRFTTNHPDRIAALAARHKLPAVYPFRYFVEAGGLISYGSDEGDQYKRAAGYVDRILKGEKPADLPVQAPTRYELVVNLKTAKALGLELPATLFARADEVIE